MAKRKLNRKEKEEVYEDVVRDVFYGLTTGDVNSNDALKAIRTAIDYTSDRISQKSSGGKK